MTSRTKAGADRECSVPRTSVAEESSVPRTDTQPEMLGD